MTSTAEASRTGARGALKCTEKGDARSGDAVDLETMASTRQPVVVPARRSRQAGSFRAKGMRGRPLTLAVVLLGLGTGVAASLTATGTGYGPVPPWVVPLVFLGAELHAFADRRGSVLASISASAAAIAFALLEGPPRIVVASNVLAVLLVSLVTGRLRSAMFLRRVGAASISAAAAVTVFDLLHGAPGSGDWAAAAAATLVATCAGGLVHAAAAGLYGATSGERIVGLLLGASSVSAGISLAAVASKLLEERQPYVAAVLALPFVSTALGIRAREQETRRLAQLSGLQESLQMAQRAHGLEADISQLLRSTSRLVDADVAWIVVLSRGDEHPLVAELCHGIEEHLRPADLSADDEMLIRRTVQADGPVAFGPETAPAEIVRAFARRGVVHGLAIALRGDRGVHSVLVVGRAESRLPFVDEEARLFQTFGTHAGLRLENESLEQSLNELTVLKEELRHRAYHDTLTGLANRTLFYDRVLEAIEGRTTGRRVAVLFLDLDDFKTVNDTLGHSAGDELLVAVAMRVGSAIRPTDIAARLGGDEFAVVADVANEDEAVSVGERLLAALEAPFVVHGSEVAVHSSVGIAFDGHDLGADELLRHADVAMYAAKRNGKRGLSVFAQEMQEEVRVRHELANALVRGVSRGEILVHYQPIVDLETGGLVALEALARWERSGQPLIGPAGFMSIADEIGVMPEIGRAVLQEACSQVRRWQRSFPDHEALTITVNLAPSELHAAALVDEVSSALRNSGLAPDRLVLEITESGVMRSPREALATMKALRELGVSLALDDFGTGHSSLAHMRDFPMDVLKIAQPFIARLPHSEVDAAFVETIMHLATALGMHVIAEGIESSAQAATVRRIGCSFGQGYLFGEPESEIGVTRYLTARSLGDGPTRLAA